MIVKTRRITSADSQYLWECLYWALHVPAGSPPLPLEILQDPRIRMYAENWGQPGDLGMWACVDQQPVAGAWLRLWLDEPKGYGYVADAIPELTMATWPNYRNQGIGSILLNELFELARPRYSGISCSVAADNPARRLYERHGFRPVTQDAASLVLIKQWD